MYKFCLTLAVTLSLLPTAHAQCYNGICIPRPVQSIIGGQDLMQPAAPVTIPTLAPQPLWYQVTPYGLVPMYTTPGFPAGAVYPWATPYDRGWNARPYVGRRLLDGLILRRLLQTPAAAAKAAS
jgi:hypothetical protein